MRRKKIGITDYGNKLQSNIRFDDDQEEQAMAKKKVSSKGLKAAKNAAPIDVFCLTWIASNSVAEVCNKLTEQGYALEHMSAVARAKRVRKGSSRRPPVPLQDMPDEGNKRATVDWQSIVAAANARSAGDGGAFAIAELAGKDH